MAIFKCLLILAVFAAIKEREKDTTVTGENNKHILYLCNSLWRKLLRMISEDV